VKSSHQHGSESVMAKTQRGNQQRKQCLAWLGVAWRSYHGGSVALACINGAGRRKWQQYRNAIEAASALPQNRAKSVKKAIMAQRSVMAEESQ
jgi:hypothetical protein